MNHFRILSVAALASLAVLSGCNGPTFSKDAVFVFAGAVTNSTGSSVVLGADDDISLCANVTYNELAQGRAVDTHSEVICETLVTNQTGQYSLKSFNKLTVAKGSDAVEIKNLKIYARKSVYDGQSTTYYVMPAKVGEIAIRPNGATVQADVIVMGI